MGADYAGQEKAIQEINALSDDAKKYLSHHIRNSLAIIIGGIDCGMPLTAREAALHMTEDIEKAGL